MKIIHKSEPRYAGFNEVKESQGTCGRLEQEIFLPENEVALRKLPLDVLFDVWRKSRLLSLKRKRKKQKIWKDYNLHKM